MDGGTLQATVHGVTQSQTQLSDKHTHTHTHTHTLIAQLVKNLPAMQETLVQFLGFEDPLEKEGIRPTLLCFIASFSFLLFSLCYKL